MRGRKREVLATSIAELQKIDLEQRRFEEVDARGSDSLLYLESRSIGSRKARASTLRNLKREKLGCLAREARSEDQEAEISSKIEDLNRMAILIWANLVSPSASHYHLVAAM